MNLRSDCKCIDLVLMRFNAGVRARLVHSKTRQPMALVAPVCTVYRLVHSRPGVRMEQVRRIMPEVQAALRQRYKSNHVHVRLDENAHAIEVYRPDAQPIYVTDKVLAQLPEFVAAIGKAHEFGRTVRYTYNLADPERAHILIAGSTGSGKTEALRSIVTTLAHGASPDRLHLCMVDLKNRGLAPFRSLPHVRAWTADAQDATKIVQWVAQELQRRIDSNAAPEPRIVLVIDELAQLYFAGAGEVFERAFPTIATRGRELGVHMIISAQNPAKGVLGGQLRTQFATKIIGHLEDARTANYITGRVNSGAEHLPGRGQMLLIDGGNDPIRVQVYMVADVRQMAANITERWPGQQAPPIEFATASSSDGSSDALAEVAESVRPVFDEYYRRQGGGLTRGGKAAIIRAIFGDDTNTGGKFDRFANRVIAYLEGNP